MQPCSQPGLTVRRSPHSSVDLVQHRCRIDAGIAEDFSFAEVTLTTQGGFSIRCRFEPKTLDMIVAQRSYESNSRVVKAGDEMLQQLNQLAQ